MKALDDALSVLDISDQLRILESIPSKEYPVLLREIETHRDRLRQHYSELRYDSDEYKSLHLELEPQEYCLKLAVVVACQGKKKLPKDWYVNNEILDNQDVLDFMLRATPVWLPDVIERKLGNPYDAKIFDLARRYIQAGAIPAPPSTSQYFGRLVGAVSRHALQRLDLAKKFLCENRDLVEWDLHQALHHISGKGVRDLSYFIVRRDPEGELDTTLMAVVSELCAEDQFSLIDLIRTTLESMLDTPREIEARGLISAHREFLPTPEQSLEIQSNYFSLLASPHKAVVKFGIEAIGSFHHLTAFDAVGFIGQVTLVFGHDSNPLQIAGLDLIKQVVVAHPAVSEIAPDFIAPVFLNPHPKVQAVALEVFKSLQGSSKDRISEAISPYAERIIGSLRSGFAVWMPAELDREETSTIPPSEHETEIGARMHPIASADDLAFVANELLDQDIDPMRFEQFLDGLARFATDHRAMLAKKFSPLQKRALNFSLGQNQNGRKYADVLILASRLIVLLKSNTSAADDFTVKLTRPAESYSWPSIYTDHVVFTTMEFARSRIDEVLAGIRDGRTLPLLALPEFDFGFISPATLLDRFELYKKARVQPGHFDFIQAIARCDLGGLDSTPVEIPTSEDEASRVLRFLFSGEVQGNVETPSWWLAAARTREPFGDFSNHEQLGAHDDENMPDWCLPAAYRPPPSIRYGSWSDDDRSWNRSDSNSPLLPKRPSTIPADWLYPKQHCSLLFNGSPCGSDLRWRYSFTPGLLDAVIAQDVKFTHREAWDMDKDLVKAGSAVMGELAKRKPPLRFTMQVHLLLALDSGPRAEREAGIDLFIQASEDGRLAAAIPGMAEVFSQLMQGASKPCNAVLQLARLVPSLRQLSTRGPLLQIQLRDILLPGLANPPLSVPTGLPSLLELILDLVTAHPPERSLDLNKAWGGILGGKAKSLAARIAKAGGY